MQEHILLLLAKKILKKLSSQFCQTKLLKVSSIHKQCIVKIVSTIYSLKKASKSSCKTNAVEPNQQTGLISRPL